MTITLLPCLCKYFSSEIYRHLYNIQISVMIPSNLISMLNKKDVQDLFTISNQSLSRSWYTDLDYGLHRLPKLELGLMAGVTDRQGMVTPPTHLIYPPVYSEVRVCPILKVVRPTGLMRLMSVWYKFMLFHSIQFCLCFQYFFFSHTIALLLFYYLH
jgi:hypothetical protein